jgi:hypothetical protein
VPRRSLTRVQVAHREQTGDGIPSAGLGGACGGVRFPGGYVALDAISGIAASALLVSGAPWSTQASRALFALGPVALPTELALVAWLVAVLLAAWALYRAGRPLARLVLLVATKIWLTQDHGGVRGVAVFGGFALAAT